jgi:hypothetical protein
MGLTEATISVRVMGMGASQLGTMVMGGCITAILTTATIIIPPACMPPASTIGPS